MMAGPGKSNAVSLQSGLGRIRAGTVSVGSHVIAIDNIGTISIVRGQRSWWLFFLGALVIGGAATQLNAYGAIAIAGIGFGIALVLGHVAQRVESGLSIGTSDGCATLIVSRDPVFLQRLLQLLVDRIDTCDQTIIADFDIARGAISTPSPSATGDQDPLLAAPARAEPVARPLPKTDARTATETGDDADDALFADPDPINVKSENRPAAPQRTPAPPPSIVLPAPQAARRQPFDRLLDSGAKAASMDDDWLAPQDPAPPASGAESDGGSARVLLALLIVTILGAGVFAAWYFTGETGPATSMSTIEVPVEIKAETPAETPGLLTQAVNDLQLPLAASIAAEPQLLSVESAPAPKAVSDPAPLAQPEIEDFAPPMPMVARSSGQRYRAIPSMAEGVAVLAETRAGGEALTVTGRLKQPDGDWYRVELADNRTAWFKASLAVPRARFAETVELSAPRPDAAFAASAPQILEPSEGIQLTGGPQPVRLAWSHREDASIYIVEIESYDAAAQRWIEDPLYKRVTIEADTELSEMFSTAGAWRWRVRSVTADGQQSQFSRWSAFGIRN